MPIKIDGDLITINPKKMEVEKVYRFIYKGDKYGAKKNDEGEVTLFEVFG